MKKVFFRKKGAFGIWYNHNSNTTAGLRGGRGLRPYASIHQTMIQQHGFSSHDYYYAIDGLLPGSFWYTVPVEKDVEIDHWGTGLLLKLRCSYPSFLI